MQKISGLHTWWKWAKFVFLNCSPTMLKLMLSLC